MKAIVLAAGRGERMRPLTDTIPKPLLCVGGKPLIVWQVERLVEGGFDRLVVNHAWLGAQIEAALGDGSQWAARIDYSREAEALETAGGVVTALPLLMNGPDDDEPFAVVSADVHTDFDYARLAAPIAALRSKWPRIAAHLVLTDNPDHHPKGDMALAGDMVTRQGKKLNYANIAVFHPRVFDGLASDEKLRLFPWAYRLVDEGRVSGEYFSGMWDNVGTPAQLDELDRRIRASRCTSIEVT